MNILIIEDCRIMTFLWKLQAKEAGFEAETDYNFIERNNQKVFLRNIKELTDIELMNEIGVFIKSYDLETILDALKQTRKRIMIEIKSDNWGINFDYEFNKYSQENESLADTAGKMWLMLKHKGIIC